MQYKKQNVIMSGQGTQILMGNTSSNSAAHSRRTSQKSGKSIGGQSQGGKGGIQPNALNKKLSNQQQFVQSSQSHLHGGSKS